MLDVGWTELLLIGVVALIVVGPKDLPVMFHALGRITARARGMAREFSSAMEDAAKASGIQDATKDLRDLQKMTNPRAMGLDALGRAADKFEKWDPLQPVREAASAVPDPAAPPPATPPQATPATPAPAAAASPATVPVASGAPSAEPQPGARRLHAVRRTDRS
ncbi:Sec-independent protein translocase protein TatB [Paracoccus niistensis]|uniref:Sec-independent protein translocase protein TatB n=1 Tax=Paracoccus niistensis TaxID=632935 RepID=A0ABV6I4M6_9RHOB